MCQTRKLEIERILATIMRELERQLIVERPPEQVVQLRCAQPEGTEVPADLAVSAPDIVPDVGPHSEEATSVTES
jgi:hypothetical protein